MAIYTQLKHQHQNSLACVPRKRLRLHIHWQRRAMCLAQAHSITLYVCTLYTTICTFFSSFLFIFSKTHRIAQATDSMHLFCHFRRCRCLLLHQRFHLPAIVLPFNLLYADCVCECVRWCFFCLFIRIRTMCRRMESCVFYIMAHNNIHTQYIYR